MVDRRSLVDEAIGTQENVASSLKEAINQSTSCEDMTIQRSSKGAIGFLTADQSGVTIVIENTTSGARAKTQNLKGWRLQKTVSGRVTVDVPIKDIDLTPGSKFTFWAKGAKERATSDNEQIVDHLTFGVGPSTVLLLDDSGTEKAVLVAKFRK